MPDSDIASNGNTRRLSRRVAVRHGDRTVVIGGGEPVVVQSMTNTPTADAQATAGQVRALALAGAELVRITVNTDEAAKAVPEIRSRLDDAGCDVPLIGDFHYNGHELLGAYPACAKALSKYRINPGNAGSGRKKDPQFAKIVETAAQYGKCVRIGVNAGSAEREVLERLERENALKGIKETPRKLLERALVESAVSSAKRAEEIGLPPDAIVVSVKLSGVPEVVSATKALADACDYPIHLGLTEAGGGLSGVVSSACALSVLLSQGIGDTIRVSVTPEPGAPRESEIAVAKAVLESMGLASYSPKVISCPGCGRTDTVRFTTLAGQVNGYIASRKDAWLAMNPETAKLKVAVMGCVVNGPGEAKSADIGISLPGAGEKASAVVFSGGKKTATLRGENIGEVFCGELEAFVKARYGSRGS